MLEKNKCFSVLVSLIVKLYSNYSNNIKKYEVYEKTKNPGLKQINEGNLDCSVSAGFLGT